MTIVNQDYELINYDKFAKISMYEGEVDGTTIYAIVAFESVPDDIDSDNDTVLGIYNNAEECENVLLNLIEALNTGKPVYEMPKPIEEVTA